jgi:hypothetical protein
VSAIAAQTSSASARHHCLAWTRADRLKVGDGILI